MVATLRANIRGDLIRRLFAVAISVGAASTIARMDWVTKGVIPDLNEWRQIAILLVAMTATVLSWDGYLVAIDSRPLEGFWRFAIDILLVFMYMFLLMTSKHLTWWLPIHAITFCLYVVWDLLTVIEHTDKYYIGSVPSQQSIFGVYKGGLGDSATVNTGPIVTIFWAIYFIALYFISKNGLNNRIFVTSSLALLGLIIYRQDKYYKFSKISRPLVVIILLLLAYVGTKLGFEDTRLVRFLGF